MASFDSYPQLARALSLSTIEGYSNAAARAQSRLSRGKPRFASRVACGR